MQTQLEGPVLITGGSGYLGSWIVAKLLESGARVRATVRDPDDEQKTAHLRMLGERASGRLELVRADLLAASSLHAAVAGCSAVIHTASPFIIGKVADPQAQLVDPAVTGTRNLLDAVNACASVTRVALTSSVVAVYGDACELAEGGQFNEDHWNTTSSLKYQPYSFAKTSAERLAWAMAENQSRWTLAVLNPGFIMGPALSRRSDGASFKFLHDMLSGRLKAGAPALWFGCVDVRTVAQAHITACFDPRVQGRHILVAESLSMSKIADHLRTQFPELKTLPTAVLPAALVYAVGPLNGLSWRYVYRNLGKPIAFDTRRSREQLGIEYPPIAGTLGDHARQMSDDKLL